MENTNSNIQENKNELIKVLQSIDNTLQKNERGHENVLNKQLEVHSRQLKIFFGTASLFVLFLILSSIYIKVLISDIRETQSTHIEEINKRERVTATVAIFRDMWLWYYSAIKEDTLFKKYTANRATIKDADSLLKNPNINRFYNYFEILKSMDISHCIDHPTAENLLPFFSKMGTAEIDSSSCYYINEKRYREHFTNVHSKKVCNCGELLDGYSYILKNILHKDIPATTYNCNRNE